MTDFSTRYGPWAVVCGASEGMGAQFGLQLAQRGLDVVLVARRAEALTEVQRQIERETKRQVKTVAIDLAGPDAVPSLASATAGLDVGLLIYNAAFCPLGPFLEQSTDENLRALEVNVKQPLLLAHHFGRRLAARGRGGLVLLSSLTAFQGSPFVTTYGATKAFNLSFAEGLWYELRAQNVDVLSVCAGATRTPNYLKSSPQEAPGILDPAQVVREALDALGRQPSMIPGWFNRAASMVMRKVLSRRLTIAIMGDQTRKLQKPKELPR
jgi:short-subunit dehydrogenase